MNAPEPGAGPAARPAFAGLLRRLSRWLALAAGGCLVLVTALMFVDVVGRYLFSAPLTFAVELVELAMGLVITLGLAWTTLQRGHIRVDFLLHLRSRALRRLLDLLADLAALAFLALVAWQLLRKALQMLRDGTFTQILELPFYPVVLAMSLAAAIAVAVALAQLVRPDLGRGGD